MTDALPGGMTSVILDCDPGIDDAFALLLALAAPSIELLGVTTVAGNRPLGTVTRNALDLLALYGHPEVPVHAGQPKPLVRDQVTANSHGVSGLGDEQLVQSPVTPASNDAAGFLIDALMKRPSGSVTLVAIGPLTNLAVALQREPLIATRAREVVIMGGGANCGNMTPVAEFNFYADPEAAQAVLEGEWPITLLGLNLTWQSTVTHAFLDRLNVNHSPLASVLKAWLGFYAKGESTPGGTGPSLHDACAIAHVIDPTLIATVPAFAVVETVGRWTYGESVIVMDGSQPANVSFGVELDRERFWGLVLDSVDRLSDPDDLLS